MKLIDTAQMAKLIKKGIAPDGVRVAGRLDLVASGMTALPAGLIVDTLDLSECAGLLALPPDLQVRRLILDGCTRLTRLPEGFSCYELSARRTGLTGLPADLRVSYRLDLTGSPALTSLPPGLKVGVLILRDCPLLTALPEGLAVYFLDIAGCAALATWPASATVQIGCVDMHGCRELTTLPPGLANLAWLDLADTGVTALPPSLADVRLRWRGVPVEARHVFAPETITAEEVLHERNAEKRRVFLERMGYEAFLAQSRAEVLDRDHDPGGPRQLVRVALGEDEPLVCVAVRCPSTARQYVIRVPPTTRTCHQAAAWIAGFDNPADYAPVMET